MSLTAGAALRLSSKAVPQSIKYWSISLSVGKVVPSGLKVSNIASVTLAAVSGHPLAAPKTAAT